MTWTDKDVQELAVKAAQGGPIVARLLDHANRGESITLSPDECRHVHALAEVLNRQAITFAGLLLAEEPR